MTDAGLLDPIVDRHPARASARSPTRIVIGSALLALLVHLDGSGAVTFLVTVPAMLPLYERLRMDQRVLACVVSMAAGVNFLPWTGPTLRASAALHIPTATLFPPLIPVQLVGLAVRVRGRLVARPARRAAAGAPRSTRPRPPPRRAQLTAAEAQALRRPGRFWINAAADARRDGRR